MSFLKAALFTSLILLFSCNQDEDDNADLADQLTGNWQAYLGTITDCEDFDDNRPGINYGDCADESAYCFEISFNPDGTVTAQGRTSSSSQRDFDGTYSTSGNILTVCLTQFTDCFVYQAEVHGDELTMIEGPIEGGCIFTTCLLSF